MALPDLIVTGLPAGTVAVELVLAQPHLVLAAGQRAASMCWSAGVGAVAEFDRRARPGGDPASVRPCRRPRRSSAIVSAPLNSPPSTTGRREVAALEPDQHLVVHLRHEVTPRLGPPPTVTHPGPVALHLVRERRELHLDLAARSLVGGVHLGDHADHQAELRTLARRVPPRLSTSQAGRRSPAMNRVLNPALE